MQIKGTTSGEWIEGRVEIKTSYRSYEIMTDSEDFQIKWVHINKIARNDGCSDRIILHNNNTKPSDQIYLIANKISNTETLKDDGITEAVANHDKAITTEVTLTPCNALYIMK